jgi:geranyl-CoA carboxylase alpha subunit
VNIAVRSAGVFDVADGAAHHTIELLAHEVGAQRKVRVDGVLREVFATATGATLHLATDGATRVFYDHLRVTSQRATASASNELRAPMNGRVVRILANSGETIARGQCVVVLEAMKMQHEITAEREGTLDSVTVREGQQVATRALLATLR